MLAGRKEQRQVPHEDGQWVEFQTLSGAQLDEAEEIQTQRSMALVKNFDANTLRAWSETSKPQQVDTSAAARFDKDTLIKHGVVAWSLEEECNDANKALLDSQTREWAVSVILEMNVRPLETSGESSAISNGAGSQQTSQTLLASSVEG